MKKELEYDEEDITPTIQRFLNKELYNEENRGIIITICGYLDERNDFEYDQDDFISYVLKENRDQADSIKEYYDMYIEEMIVWIKEKYEEHMRLLN